MKHEDAEVDDIIPKGGYFGFAVYNKYEEKCIENLEIDMGKSSNKNQSEWWRYKNIFKN